MFPTHIPAQLSFNWHCSSNNIPESDMTSVAVANRHGQEFLGVQEVAELPCRYRSQHLNTKACFWSGSVQLERLGRLQTLCLEFDLCL